MPIGEVKSGAIVEIYKNRSIYEADIVLPNGEKLERCTVKRKDMGKKADYISTSRIESFCSCPSMYKQTFIEQTLDTSSIFTERGTFMHSMMEYYVNEYMKDGTVVEVNDLLGAFEESELVNFKDYAEVRKMVGEFINAYPVNKWDFNPIATEQEFVVDWNGTVVSGIIDLVGVDKSDDSTLVIVDYKSNFLNWTAEDLANSLQLQLYSAVCRELYPQFKKIKCMYFMIKTKTIQICPDFSDDTLDAVREYVCMMDKKINNSDFEPKLNTYCCYRECRHSCPVFQKMLEEEEPTNAEDVLQQRDYYYAREKNASSLRKECDRKLKELIKKDGAIIKDGYQYSINNIKKETLDYKKLEKVLLSHNRLDLLNGFVQMKDEERFLLIVNKLDDLFLKLEIMQCVVPLYSASAISKKKVPK